MSEITTYLMQSLEQMQTEHKEILAKEVQSLAAFKEQIQSQVSETSEQMTALLERFEALHAEIMLWEQPLKNSAKSYDVLLKQFQELQKAIMQYK